MSADDGIAATVPRKRQVDDGKNLIGPRGKRTPGFRCHYNYKVRKKQGENLSDSRQSSRKAEAEEKGREVELGTTTMGIEKVKGEALKILNLFQVLPRLVVFDLDHTLWPFYCQCCSKQEMPSLYPHAKGILYALKDKGVDVAIASRSPTPDIAKTFLDKLEIRSMFVAQEIFSSRTHKTEHFQRIHRRTGLPFNSMLFFDDEDRNIEAVSKVGVSSILVGNGVNVGALRQGLTVFTQNSVSSDRNNQKPLFF